MEKSDTLPDNAGRSTRHKFSTNLNEDLVTGHTKSCTADILNETANVSLHNTPYHPSSIVISSTYHTLTIKAVVMTKSFSVIQIMKIVELKTLLAAVRIEPAFEVHCFRRQLLSSPYTSHDRD
jgi:hypothetical protein